MGPFLRPSEGVQAANGPADICPLFCPLRSRTSHHAGRGKRGPPAAAGASLGPPARARHRAGARPLVCLGPARVAENARRRIFRRGGHRDARPPPCVPCGQAAGQSSTKGHTTETPAGIRLQIVATVDIDSTSSSRAAHAPARFLMLPWYTVAAVLARPPAVFLGAPL